MKSKKSKAWFKRIRWSYLPVSWQGWLTYIPFVAYLVLTFAYFEHTTHTIAGTVLGALPHWVIATIVMQWLASHKS